MTIRSALAHALVKQGLVTEEEMYSDEGILKLDRVISAIVTDSQRVPDLLAIVESAIDPYGVTGSAVAFKKPSANEVLARLRRQGVVVTLDRRVKP